MNSDLARAAEYRTHAGELRDVALESRAPWANAALRKAADHYDGLAMALERARVAR